MRRITLKTKHRRRIPILVQASGRAMRVPIFHLLPAPDLPACSVELRACPPASLDFVLLRRSPLASGKYRSG